MVHACRKHTISSRDSKRKTIEIIDREIDAIDTTLRDISALIHSLRLEACCRRNTLLTVNNLPTEVLCHIFLAIGSSVRDKVSVSQTCSRWREVALKYPFMWTSLNLDEIAQQNLVPSIMKRSGGFPLQVKCTNWNYLRHTLCALELYRVQDLDITVDNYGSQLYQDWLHVRHAPVLSHLRIECKNEVTIPPLFAGKHPSLRELHLLNCRMPFARGNFRGLKILSIESIDLPDSKHGIDVDIIHVFRDCPELEEVVLEGCSCLDEDPHAEALGVVKLPLLRSMQLGLEARCIRRILSFISTPPSAVLKLHFYTDFKEPGDRSPFTSPNNPMATLFDNFRSFVVHGPRLEVFGFSDREFRFPTFEASFDIDDYARISRIITPIAKFFPMTNLQRLQVHKVPDEDVITLLKSAPTITRLDIRCEEEHQQLEDLTRGMHPTGIVQRLVHEVVRGSKPLCSRLRTLSLDSVFLGYGNNPLLWASSLNRANVSGISRCTGATRTWGSMKLFTCFNKITKQWSGLTPGMP
ncbi:hypothetical protein NLI96_g4694 [Meripilus lineatus]|uniref:F-box domain-containing protein n=1 Tax=Meripilus lineatus TaxID=2056292 RepID=A0AAD5YHR2_9APHY|nr:hypothetical protein NLI96_g4694 [Physisporinus lineatus]